MTQCTAELGQLTLPFRGRRTVAVQFDAPHTSSDGGALLLRQVDEREGVTAAMAAVIGDHRSARRIQHSRQEQLQQRIFGIALGYEDANDADTLRHDPMLLAACNRDPFDASGLSSQPTLTRLENSVDFATVKRLMRWLVTSYVETLPADTSSVVLDIDATDDETHGGQQLSFFHGYYDHHMYHPLLVFDGDSGQLITAVLRPGNTHASRGAHLLLSHIIKRLKERFPDMEILVRGDAGFAVPRVLDELERLDEAHGGVTYLLGLAKNPALLRLAEPGMAQAAAQFDRDRLRIRHFTEFSYAAGSWPHKRRVILKAEHSPLGTNPRFVVTNLEEFSGELLYTVYCQRGQAENYIKELKNALFADRLSCSSFVANAFRLMLHAATYRLMHALRRVLRTFSPVLAQLQFDTLRLRLLKVAALVTASTRRILIRLPRTFPFARSFATLARTLSPPGQTA